PAAGSISPGHDTPRPAKRYQPPALLVAVSDIPGERAPYPHRRAQVGRSGSAASQAAPGLPPRCAAKAAALPAPLRGRRQNSPTDRRQQPPAPPGNWQPALPPDDTERDLAHSEKPFAPPGGGPS